MLEQSPFALRERMREGQDISLRWFPGDSQRCVAGPARGAHVLCRPYPWVASVSQTWRDVQRHEEEVLCQS
jgi:hypothetical protein